MAEVWKDVVGFEGFYVVSNHGRVKSCTRCYERPKYCFPEKLMKLHHHTNGYQVVWLRKPKIHKKFYVHRLVAFAFIENPDGKDFVNHMNKDRFNNTVMNLEWCTHQENCDHRDNYQPSDEPF